MSELVQLIKQESCSNWRKTNSHFIPELVTCCFRLSHYPLPHLFSSLTWLPALVT